MKPKSKIFKKLILIIILIVIIKFTAFAQNVAITDDNTYIPNTSAMLDIYSLNKGFLMPRLTLVQRNTIVVGAAQTGLVLYQTDNNPGFYYYTGTAWTNLCGGSSTGWLLTGNTGTSALINFIGTIDNVDFVTKTNNLERCRVLSTGNILFNRNTALYATDLFETQGNIAFPDAICGYTSAVGGNAIYGINTAGGASSSIYGEINSATGYGIQAFNANVTGTGIIASGNNIGATYLSGGSGGAFTGTAVGVFGYGNNTALSHGVEGWSDNSTGTGVYGLNNSSAGVAAGFGGYFVCYQTGGAALVGTLGASSYFSGTAISGITVNTIVDGKGGLFGCDNTTGIGVQGQTAGTTGIGVLGITNGTNAIGVEGDNINTGFYGLLGSPNEGAFGYTTDYAGTGYNYDLAVSGVSGLSDIVITNQYNFGVLGQVNSNNVNNLNRSGGVLGTYYRSAASNAWGILGYRISTNALCGVYGSSAYVTGGGKTTNTFSGIGVAGYGDLFGSWFRGDIYGMAVKGERMGLYVDGRTYTNNVITQMNDNGENDRIPTYVPTSMTVDVYMKGTAQLINGKATIQFDNEYLSIISDKDPIIVTVTPMGKTNGVYIEEIKSNGFKIVENNDGKSDVSFSWIAIATRKGYENPDNPVELLSSEYDTHLSDYMINENDSLHTGKFMWWDGKELHFDKQSEFIETNNNSKFIQPIKTIHKETFNKQRHNISSINNETNSEKDKIIKPVFKENYNKNKKIK